MRVKICGITNYPDARLALDHGVWAIGFIFYPPSPRYIPQERAHAILQKLPEDTLSVGVYVDAPLSAIRHGVDHVGLKGIQLHGCEPPWYARDIPARHVLKAFRVQRGFQLSQIDAYAGYTILLDAYREDAPGGTGATFDWNIAREAQKRVPIILAGGLTPENIEEAVQVVRPAGVDVATGVEARPGQKDPEKIRRLFEALRRASTGGPEAEGKNSAR